MLTKSPDYIISEYGYPKWQMECSKSSYKYQNINNGGNYLTQQHQKQRSLQSPTRLLPLRETLSDYYSRLLQREATTTTAIIHHHQSINYAKVQKNKYNEQIKFNENSSSRNTNTSNSNSSSRRTCLVKREQNQQQQQTANTRIKHAAVVMSLSGPATNLKLLEEQQNELNAF